MTIFMNLHAMDSAIHPVKLLPAAVLPYLVLALTERSARGFHALALIVVTMLLILGAGFWIYYDGLFVRYTTLNAPLFFEVPVLQFVMIILSGALGWWYARRNEMKDRAPTSQPILSLMHLDYAVISVNHVLIFAVYDHIIAVHVLIIGVYALIFSVYEGIFGNHEGIFSDYELMSDVGGLILGVYEGQIASVVYHKSLA